MTIQTGTPQPEKSKNTSITEKVALDQVQILFGNLVFSILANLFGVGIVFATLYRHSHQLIVLIWFGLSLLISILRLSLLYIFHYLTWSYKINLAIFIVLTLVSAVLWGVAGCVLMPDNYVLGQLVVASAISFNDSFGHEAGDEVLKFIGKLLRSEFRGNDFSYRFGGEEFLVVLQDTDIENALTRFQKLREKIKNAHIEFRKEELPPVIISIGIAMAPEQGDTVDAIIWAADHALYTAKQSGRDRVEIYT